MIKELFILISNAIETNTTVRWIDFNMGQLSQEYPPVSFPCVLISFTAANYTELGGNGQSADTRINIQVAFKVFERTNNKTPVTYRDKGLEHLDIIASIHTALNGLQGDNIAPLTRLSFNLEPRADLRVYNLVYSSVVYEVPPSEFTPVADHLPPGETIDLCTETTFTPIIES